MVLSQTGRQRKMRRTVIERSHKTTLRLVSGGKEESGSALSPFGPLKVGLITMPSTNKEVPLTELPREEVELRIACVLRG